MARVRASGARPSRSWREVFDLTSMTHHDHVECVAILEPVAKGA
ncbi:hypothetical protein [Streptomyces sp. NPDC054797]